ncbi:hypothetical protein EXW72_10120 [Pseudomonas sp. BCA14]|uniref:hypothetical protein n=1 Tax=unclassified Pseudomonas TaxID=196821 RepID=UPI00106E1A8B|nr:MULTISPECIES: hypothetical protein [unclassified Pseudomonas]TFF09676.1 hypothetical protein EXW70_11620 [Pseudomonas sp. JMN1]TFF11818.1 hypothetical protein EXW71_09370 [Pseudomonas sp. BCA17]TFF28594.1 hypothetical protein EXW72_10120 [Pseudomonas sp. BCA14]
MPDITVKAIKGFNADGLDSGEKYVKRGAEFTVDESVARDLRRNGLIEEYDVKQAPEPENKQAKEADNKTAPEASQKPKPELKNKAK